MARCIDADALKESIKKQANICRVLGNEEITMYADVMEKGFLQEIDNAPTVDVRENEHGKWIVTAEFKDNYYAKCNKCNTTQVFYYGKPLTNFCPECGADMRPQYEEPEINPCRGCEDYDGKGGCKTKGGCAGSRGKEDE